MATVKTMRQKMADEGLSSFMVTYTADDHETYTSQYWAEDAGHAGDQCEDEGEGDRTNLFVETQDEYEARTGKVLDYGRGESL